MTTHPAPAPLTPLDVVTAAATVITARGYYQPLSRQWEEAVPTVMDVETLLFGYEHHQPGDARLFARAAAECAELPARVLDWARAPGDTPTAYRAKLARLTARATVTTRDIPLLVSAVNAWQRAQQRAERQRQAAADAARSQHQGTPGERLVRHVTVTAVKQCESRQFGYTEQPRFRVRLRDDDGHVYVWFANSAKAPQEGEHLTLSGTVAKHRTYQDTAETVLSNCRRRKPAPQRL